MPPCLLAIRSLLGSSRRQNLIFPRFQRHSPFQSPFSTQPWRPSAHHRSGIAVDGEKGRDERKDGSTGKDERKDASTGRDAGQKASNPSPSSPSSPSTRSPPIETMTQAALGAYTSLSREPYISPPKHRLVQLISKGRLTGAYSSQWDTGLAKLQLLKYTQRQDENPSTPRRKLVAFDAETVQLAEKVRIRLMPQEEHVHPQPQEGVDMLKEPSQWYDILLYLLAHDPDRALSFLHTTHHSPYPPLHAVQDSLLHLANIFRQHPDPIQKCSRFANLAGLVEVLANRSTGERLSLPHGTLAHILAALGPEQQLQLWDCVRQHFIHIHWHTHLHFASHLAAADRFDQALDAVSEAHRHGANLTSKPFLRTCSTLLRAAMRQPSGLRVCLGIVDNLVGMGVTLNLILCNIIMLNAVEAQDLTTAWSIYHSLPNYGLKADSYTFAVLLKACKVNLEDADMLNETIRNAIAHVDVKNDSILAADILHTLALHHTKRHPEKAFETLADAYSQLFDTSPLSDLGILPPTSSSREKKMPPSHAAIGIMLTTYLYQLFLQTQSPTQPRALYHRYRALVTSGVEPWCSMIDKDYIPNAFLSTLTKTKAGIMPAAEIIKTMQRPVPHAKVQQCEPTVQTWTIFMHGFQRHGQMKMAEQVLGYMRRQGIEPDQVTWNVLVEGYAVLQDVEGVEGVLKRLKDDGKEWDAWTGSSVGKLKRGFEGRKQRGGEGEGRELDFTGDLREKIAGRIAQGEVGMGGKEKEEEAKDEGGTYTPIV